MSITDDPTTFGRTRLGFADEAEIDEFAAVLGQFGSRRSFSSRNDMLKAS